MTRCFVVMGMFAVVGLVPAPGWAPAQADAAPLDCLGVTETDGPMLGDGVTPGDAQAAATPLTYGCFDARLDDGSDVDGYRIYASPVTVQVRINDDAACVHVTWLLGQPPSNAISRWLCGQDAHHVSDRGTQLMRLQVWYGPNPQMDGPTPYRIVVLPGA